MDFFRDRILRRHDVSPKLFDVDARGVVYFVLAGDVARGVEIGGAVVRVKKRDGRTLVLQRRGAVASRLSDQGLDLLASVPASVLGHEKGYTRDE